MPFMGVFLLFFSPKNIIGGSFVGYQLSDLLSI
ncbi:MAG: hypothetical protein JWP81_2258 [Ferruginibacter sp.]|nr:hypothetical protein [Ferruginibacter sp.]